MTYENTLAESENIGTAYGYGAAYSTLIENTAPGRSASGEITSVDAALGLSPVWEAVSKISGSVAGMPIKMMKQTTSGEEADFRHPVSKLLNCRPNHWQSPFNFREVMMAHALLQGNGRAHIHRNSIGQPTELRLLFPWHTYCVIMEGEKFHATYTHPDYMDPTTYPTSGGSYAGDAGEFRNGIELLHDDDVFHIPGLSYNGFWGMHLTQVAADVFGLAISGQNRVASSYANGGMPGFLIELPVNVYRDPKKRAEFRAEWEAAYRGTRNTGKMQLLPEGFKAHTAQMNANDSQLEALAKHSTEQIRRLFLLPPDEAAAYKSITERNTQYITQCLGRWIKKIEQEIWLKLLSERERLAMSHRAKMDTAELVKGDPNSWADYTGKLRQQSLISGNEGREMHGLNVIPGEESLESFGNPNITTPGDVAESNEAPDESEAEETEATEAENRALTLHFENMVNTEMREVKKNAGREDFVAWAENWYGNYRKRFSTMLKRLDLPTQVAHDHVDRSLDDLATVCGNDDVDARAIQIRTTADNWHNAISRILDDVRSN